MEKDPREVLSESFCVVAERLAFMFGEVTGEDGPPPAPADCAAVTMGFHGRFGGSLMIAVPAEMGSEIVANVLGVDPDDETVTVKPFDALKELLNVTCGHVLTALAGEEPVFSLTVPEIADLDAGGWRQLAEDPRTVAFLVDEYPVLLRLVLDEQ